MIVLIFSLGVWLLFTPLLFGVATSPCGISDALCGLALIAGGLLLRSRLQLGIGLLGVGVWLQLSPLVFWAPSALSYLNDTGVGMLAVILAFQWLPKKEEENVSPSGWSFNPSGWPHRRALAVLALLCACCARYMALFQLGYRDSVWDPFFAGGTLHVITSPLSRSFPLSDAGLGALCYTLEFLLAWQGGVDRWIRMPWLVFSFAFLVIPVGVISIILIISQPLVVGAWCSWCLATALLMLLMIVLAAPEFVATCRLLASSKARGESPLKVFWRGSSLKLKTRVSRETLSQGWTLPLSLALAFVVGGWVVVSPYLFKNDASVVNFMIGPLVMALAIAACAEVFRSLRHGYWLLGGALILSAFLMHGGLNNAAAGILLILLSRHPGRILERYS